jgi:hypothetical protein
MLLHQQLAEYLLMFLQSLLSPLLLSWKSWNAIAGWSVGFYKTYIKNTLLTGVFILV